MRRLLTAIGLLIAVAAPAAAQVTVPATPQFLADDNTGSNQANITGVNVTSGETLMTVAFNRVDAGQTSTTATHGVTSLGTPIVDDSVADGIGVTAWCTTGLSGSQTVTVNFSASTFWHVYVIRLAGAAASTPCGTPSLNSSGGAGTAVSATVSSVTNGLVISAVLVRDLFASTLAPDAGQTELLESTGTAAYASATASEAGAASVTSGWTWTGGIENRIVVIAVAPAAGGGGGGGGGHGAMTGIIREDQ